MKKINIKKNKMAGKKKKFELFVKKTTSAGAGQLPVKGKMPMKKMMK